MGWALGWVAVQGRGDVLAALGLRATGAAYDYSAKKGYGFGALPGGWTLVVSRNCDEFMKPKRMEALKGFGRVVSAGLEEHVMYSGAAEWRDGAEVWRVERLAEDGADHLAASGALPPAFTKIRDTQLRGQEAESEDVDHVIAVPLMLAEAITGFNVETGPRLETILKMAEPVAKQGGLFGLFR